MAMDVIRVVAPCGACKTNTLVTIGTDFLDHEVLRYEDHTDPDNHPCPKSGKVVQANIGLYVHVKDLHALFHTAFSLNGANEVLREAWRIWGVRRTEVERRRGVDT